MLSFEKLQELLSFATRPEHGFYRKLYGMQDGAPALNLESQAAWERLPLVTKDALIDMPLSMRSFKPLGELDHLRTSSGTSGKPPLFSPRTHVEHMEYRLKYHDFKNPFLAFTVPLMPHWHERFAREHGGNPHVVVYDPKHPAASVAVARAAGVDAFSVFVYHVPALGEEMKRAGIHTKIKLAEITGEVCSRAQFEYLRETFPNATILQSYNSSEVEDAHIGMPCKPVDGTEPLAVYHPKATHYLELLDQETGAILKPAPGIEGDLVVTAYPGTEASFPLIRFRIGDTARVVSCPCPHESFSFTILGRTDLDFLKVPGGILRADEVARVLRLFPEVSDRFELRCSEVATKSGPRLCATLYIEARDTVDLEAFAQTVAENLRVAPALTYAEGSALGRYMPMRCKPLQTPVGGKTRRITLE